MPRPADVGGASGSPMGPYWRRKLGLTHPGEMTGAELQRANLLRRAMGLPAVGGHVGFDTPVGPQARQDDGNAPHAGAMPADNLAAGAMQPGGEQQQFASVLQGAENAVQPPVDPGFNHGMIPGGPMQGQGGGMQDIRSLILRRLQGGAPAATSAQALMRHLAGTRGGMGGGHRPVLPSRKPLPY